MKANVLKYHLNRLNISPKDLSLFSGLSQSKCYRLVNLSPIDLLSINYLDKRAIERAICEIESVNAFTLDLSAVYNQYKKSFTRYGELMHCTDCNTAVYDDDVGNNGYFYICKHCNGETVVDI